MSISQASSSFSSSTPPKKFIATTLSTVSSKHLIFSRYDPVQNALHAFFLNMIDEYVTKPWFASISTNKDFQHQLLIFISQLTYGLEERIIKVDWNQVFFADIPYLLKQHANAYEYSKNSILPHLFQSVYPMSFDLVYHSLIPHVAMVDQQSEQDYLRCFVDHALKQLGPSYLSEADLENVLYREILTNLLEFIWNSVSEPDFIILWITFWVLLYIQI
ncbi:hypothetical protein HMI55_004194 [Coelomomyces lativittatus]|nr:hypothetical protein HMI56_004853 [Coelomomyces lativittatus]KAJ1514939.1 hypothetical protein HMI55_004194 [Coelomomyces lativittatus]